MKGLTIQWLEVWFYGHLVADFGHEVGGKVPDFIVSNRRVAALWTGEGMLN